MRSIVVPKPLLFVYAGLVVVLAVAAAFFAQSRNEPTPRPGDAQVCLDALATAEDLFVLYGYSLDILEQGLDRSLAGDYNAVRALGSDYADNTDLVNFIRDGEYADLHSGCIAYLNTQQ